MTTKSKALANAIREYGIKCQQLRRKRGEFAPPAVKYDADYLARYFRVNINTLKSWLKKKSDGVPVHMHEHIEAKLREVL